MFNLIRSVVDEVVKSEEIVNKIDYIFFDPLFITPTGLIGSGSFVIEKFLYRYKDLSLVL